MKMHEFEAKALLSKYGVPIPRNAGAVDTPDETAKAAEKLGGRAVLKAQVHSGGRGKGGGIKVAETPEEARELAGKMLGMLLVTHQAPQGIRVEKLLVEEPISIAAEYYASILPDRLTHRDTLMLSAKGGMDIEAVAEESPEAIVRLAIDPLEGLHDYELRAAILAAGLDPKVLNKICALLKQLYIAYVATDASLVEINPLAVTADGRVLAADAKIQIDDSALYRHAEFDACAAGNEEDAIEAEAHKLDIAYVRLDGNVGIICNGAGLTMTTMDEVKRAGGHPANFLDVGGGARAERVEECLKLVLSDPNVRGVLINIFGGITRCDEVAAGLVTVMGKMHLTVPVVVRLAGTRSAEGAKILSDAQITPCATMQAAAASITALVNQTA